MTAFDPEKRRCLRHPLHIPIRLELGPGGVPAERRCEEISQGGLSFWWDRRLGRGQFLIITIPVKEKSFRIRARVAYSLKDARTGHFRTGVEFKDPESAFRARLAEETIEIIEYRKKVSIEKGFEVSEEQAAEEWIRRYAQGLPGQSRQ